MEQREHGQLAPFWQVALALGVVYLVWGSTYLAIRIAVLGMPPFLMAGGRWVLAGAILMVVAALLRHPVPTRREVFWSGLVGWLLLIGGNGVVTWAEQTISSGLAALLVASLPLWVLAFESLLPTGARPTPLGLAGIVLGFLGVGVLVYPSLEDGSGGALWAQLVVLGGTALWAIGTLMGRYVALPRSGLYNTAWSAIIAGAGFFGLAGLTGEYARFTWQAVPGSAWLALGYLVVFGSCLAFSCYTWLVQNSRPALFTTYAYVNPVVAVLLGVRYLGEPLTPWTLAGTIIIVASVALVLQGGRHPA